MNGSAVPDTDPVALAAAWVRAFVLNDATARARIGENLDDTALAVFLDSAFAVAVRRRFVPECDVREIARLMLGVRQRYGAKSPGILEMEMLVRKELGEPVPIDDLEDSTASVMKLSVLEQMIYDMGMYEKEVEAMLDEAVRVTRQADR